MKVGRLESLKVIRLESYEVQRFESGRKGAPQGLETCRKEQASGNKKGLSIFQTALIEITNNYFAPMAVSALSKSCWKTLKGCAPSTETVCVWPLAV
jgi:hypothetical protein